MATQTVVVWNTYVSHIVVPQGIDLYDKETVKSWEVYDDVLHIEFIDGRVLEVTSEYGMDLQDLRKEILHDWV